MDTLIPDESWQSRLWVSRCHNLDRQDLLKILLVLTKSCKYLTLSSLGSAGHSSQTHLWPFTSKTKSPSFPPSNQITQLQHTQLLSGLLGKPKKGKRRFGRKYRRIYLQVVLISTFVCLFAQRPRNILNLQDGKWNLTRKNWINFISASAIRSWGIQNFLPCTCLSRSLTGQKSFKTQASSTHAAFTGLCMTEDTIPFAEAPCKPFQFICAFTF